MLKYLHDHILDEVKGAEDYMAKAIEHKGKQCGTMFYSMAMMELDHANKLTKMYNATEKPKTITDADYSSMTKAILDAYSTSMGKIEAMKKLYWSE